MFRSTWTILRELMLSLAKATIFFVELIGKNTSLYDLWCCGNNCSRTLHGTQYTHHSLKYSLPQHHSWTLPLV